MRAALYARVSSAEQVEGYSLDAQLAAMRELCDRREWPIAGEYVDAGLSGTKSSRPELQRLLADATAGKMDVVVVHAIDRFYRNMRGLLQALHHLRQANVTFISITENLDFSSPWGKMSLAVLGTLAEIYIDKLSAETAKGKRARAMAGLSNANIPPHGYQRLEDGSDIVVPEEADAVRFLFEQYASGRYTMKTLADRMEREGWPPSKRSGQGRWTARAVGYMLRNRAYLGQVRYTSGAADGTIATEWFPGQHEAIVGEDLWQRAERVRSKRTYGRAERRIAPVLLRGLLHCDLCGSKLYANVHPGREYHHFFCSGHRRGIDCATTGVYYNGEVFDRQVEALLGRIQPPDDWQDLLAELVNHQAERASYERRKAVAERRLEALKEQYEWGHLGRGEYLAKYDEARADLDAAQPPPEPAIVEAGQYLQNLAWDILNDEERREVLHLVFESMRVRDGRIVCIQPHREFAPLFRLMGLQEDENGCFQIEGRGTDDPGATGPAPA